MSTVRDAGFEPGTAASEPPHLQFILAVCLWQHFNFSLYNPERPYELIDRKVAPFHRLKVYGLRMSRGTKIEHSVKWNDFDILTVPQSPQVI